MPFTYDPLTGRYRNAQGRFVSNAQVRQALDTALRNAEKEIASLALRLKNGEISLTAWEFSMRQEIKSVHLYSRALGRGGWAEMTQSDFGTVGAALKKQYAYLNRFAAEIAAGYKFDGRFIARVRMYAQSGRTTYYDALDGVMLDAGFTEYQNVLSAVESCTGEGSCVQQTSFGWQPIGALIQIGQRLCITNCRCSFEYR